MHQYAQSKPSVQGLPFIYPKFRSWRTIVKRTDLPNASGIRMLKVGRLQINGPLALPLMFRLPVSTLPSTVLI